MVKSQCFFVLLNSDFYCDHSNRPMGHSVSVQPGPPALRLRFSLDAHHLCQNMSR